MKLAFRLLLLLSLMVALATTPCHAAWAHPNGKVGGNARTGGSVSTQAAAAFSASLTNPSVIIGSVSYHTTGGSVSSVTDTAGNSYASGGAVVDSTNGIVTEVWYALNTHGTASNVVTAHFSATVTRAAIVADEFTGGGSSPALDLALGQITTTASPGPYLSPAGSPAVNGELIYGTWIQDVLTPNANATTANSPLALATKNDSSTTGNFATEWESQSTAASVAATFSHTFTGTPNCLVGMLTFKPTAVTCVPSVAVLGAGGC